MLMSSEKIFWFILETLSFIFLKNKDTCNSTLGCSNNVWTTLPASCSHSFGGCQLPEDEGTTQNSSNTWSYQNWTVFLMTYIDPLNTVNTLRAYLCVTGQQVEYCRQHVDMFVWDGLKLECVNFTKKTRNAEKTPVFSFCIVSPTKNAAATCLHKAGITIVENVRM